MEKNEIRNNGVSVNCTKQKLMGMITWGSVEPPNVLFFKRGCCVYYDCERDMPMIKWACSDGTIYRSPLMVAGKEEVGKVKE